MNILLTGDDGYNSLGTRLVAHCLKDKHTLAIAGTKSQQSAVGGKMSVQHGGGWVATSVDGIPALCVDGAPSDAVECAQVYFEKSFDLVVSGMNFGENVTGAVVSSGTVSAAMRSLVLEIAPKAIALSWQLSPEFFFKKHDSSESLADYLEYPGKAMQRVLQKCLENDLWGARFLNVNFPKNETKTVRFTEFSSYILDAYPTVVVREDSNTFAYPFEEGTRQRFSSYQDAGALYEGVISITPQIINWTDYTVLKNQETREFVV